MPITLTFTASAGQFSSPEFPDEASAQAYLTQVEVQGGFWDTTGTLFIPWHQVQSVQLQST